jgi:hypothetical protein
MATRASLRWSSGGGNTTGFRVGIVSGASASKSLACGNLEQRTDSALLQTGLSPQTSYSVRICAENEDGFLSPPVDLSFQTTAVRKPDEVRSARVIEAGVLKIKLALSASPMPEYGGVRESYLIALSEGDSAPATCASAQRTDSLEAVYPGLRPDTLHSLRICVDNNDGGISPGVVVQARTSPAILVLRADKMGSHSAHLTIGRNFDDLDTEISIRACRQDKPSSCKDRTVVIRAGTTEESFTLHGLHNQRTTYQVSANAASVHAVTSLDVTTKKGWWIF